MGYNEHLGIILMRDNGPRRSFRISRRLFYGLAVFFACLPLVCAGLAWYGFTQFQKNAVLASMLEQRDSELEVARASAKRLENLDVLLQENTLEGREQILHRLAMAEEARASQLASSQKTGQDSNQVASKSATQAASQPVKAVAQANVKPDSGPKQAGQADKPQTSPDKPAGDDTEKQAPDKASGKVEGAGSDQIASGQSGLPATPGQDNRQADKPDQSSASQGQNTGNGPDEGPGHEDFQEIDEHFVRVSNVQARAFTGNRLRIAIDLHNTEKQEQAVGTIRTTLLTDAGSRHQIIYEQKDAGDFKINRFKRAVMLSKIPREFRLANSQIQLEVFMQDGNLVYRNIYSVER